MVKKGLLLIAGSFVLSACVPQQPIQSPEFRNVSYQTSKQGAELAKLSDRVRIVERAMLRLDTRMKLVERNELSRISSNQQQSSFADQASYKPTAYTTSNNVVNFARINSPFAKRIQPNYTATSMQSNLVTSSLQVAPKAIIPVQAQAQHQLASANNVIASLPSLADTSAANQEKDVSIWTIEYSENKIWPTRDQLAESKNVVDLLKGETPVAVFARGANPSSKEFRERVRALSRYLGKVANSQDVAIASMPANHLDRDTIEVLVAK